MRRVLVTCPSKKETDFICGVLTASDVRVDYDILTTGIGGIQTAYSLTKAISKKSYDCMIQLGIAGAIDAFLEMGKVYVIVEDGFGDMGAWEEDDHFRTSFDLGLEDSYHFPFINGRLINPLRHAFAKKAIEKFSLAKGVSVNQITTSSKTVSYFDMLGFQVESMEGAAFHFLGLSEGIPFLQLRAISNVVGERNRSKWRIEEALLQLRHALLDLIT